MLRADEEWKVVPEYEGLYEVSNTGKVRNILTGNELKQRSVRGYQRVALYKDRKRQYKSVHRLVAAAFIRLPYEGEQVNHKDLNKANNNVENLEWCDQSYNIHHSWASGGRTKNLESLMKVLRKETVQVDMDGSIVRVWPSMSDAARELGLSVSNICNCCSGRIKSTGGYKWRRASDICAPMK